MMCMLLVVGQVVAGSIAWATAVVRCLLNPSWVYISAPTIELLSYPPVDAKIVNRASRAVATPTRSECDCGEQLLNRFCRKKVCSCRSAAAWESESPCTCEDGDPGEVLTENVLVPSVPLCVDPSPHDNGLFV
ncbi:hypothetical protein BDZ85DRAFT_80697 [Elsinoe ampelina]|uniref:Uncharacterized protein n=1 Tax=Elsinoe ampelina TaxID=302913 RepID=A0A6A6FYW7_9PEZI|nr:hypothetical protein BDZ85DRAFT_80697 [Elsinoe ampelina]